MKSYPYYLANKPQSSKPTLEVLDKHTLKPIAHVAVADTAAIETAITEAVKATATMAALPAYIRTEVFQECIAQFLSRHDELVETLCLEAGKPKRDATQEVARLIETFRMAVAEISRPHGEVLPMEMSPRMRGYHGQWKRVPIGPCSFITPFNFPLNLVAHKIAPAIAVGCPFILKPASLTPISALILGEILSQTALPRGAFSILPCDRQAAELFTTDPRLKMLSFTGSPEVGWALKAKSGKKKVTLELGGNAACIIEPDANLTQAVSRIVVGSFSNSGQSCISVQRIFVHESIYSVFRDKLVSAVQTLSTGDPSLDETQVGPMISKAEADRLWQWIESASHCGAKVLCGFKRHGNMITPTLLENVPATEKLCSEEAFGPVAILDSYSHFSEAIRKVNDSRFGLQAGVFTRDLEKMYLAWDHLDVGGVVIGDIPSFRADHMPYGGVKDSGLGREGVRFAMEDMTEIKMLIVRVPVHQENP